TTPAPPAIYPLSLHDALPISGHARDSRGVPRHRRRAHRLHEGTARALPRPPPLLRALAGVPAARGLRAARVAEPEPHPALPATPGGDPRDRPAHQRRDRRAGLATDRLPRTPPRASGDPRLVPGRPVLRGELAARRHEPGGQG